MKTQQFLTNLENEIKQTEESLVQKDQLERLQEVWKHYSGEDKVISSLELAEIIKSRPEEYKILSNWSGVDNILKGFRLKQVVVIAAPTKSGKTSWCIDLTTRIRNEKPLWLPFEEGAEELITKFIERKEEPPQFFTPERITGNTLEWVEQKIIESIVKHKTRVVFIDHLHFIVPLTAERIDQRIGDTMRRLKGMAKKWNVTIFLIAHLKKTRLDEQPTMEDLRDSSFIAQEADTVIMLWRQMEREQGRVVITNNVNLSIQANRRTGKTGNVKFIFENGKFIEKEWKTVDESFDSTDW